MNDQQRTQQQQACHIQFKRLQAEGALPTGVAVYDLAREICGRAIQSLKELQDWELNALRDRLEGKTNKLLDRILAEAERGGIRDLAAWMATVSRSVGFEWLKNFTPETLPAKQQWRLLKILERRGTGRRRPAPRACPRGVSTEQRMLWGM